MSCMFPVVIYVYAIELRIATVSVCHICLAHPRLRVSLYTSGLVSVPPSHSLDEYNYTIYDKELLSVICRLEEWRHILEGTKHRIEILNDH